MDHRRDLFLNVLLGILTVTSVALSSLVWFPSDHAGFQATTEAQVQAAPPDGKGRVPNVARPERVVLKRKDGHVAELILGTPLYERLWNSALSALSGMQPRLVTGPLEEAGAVPADEESVTLVLPTSLRLGDWAEQWTWSTVPPAILSFQIDRITFRLGKSALAVFSGPDTASQAVGPLTELDLRRLLDLMQLVEPAQFFKPRALDPKILTVRVLPGVLVPEITTVPVVSAQAQKPIVADEAARFFPDLSVVRQIDEKDAKNLTDGQRLLRLAANGVLEFRTAPSPVQAVEFSRVLTAAKEWVESHGGWPQDVLISSVLEQAGETRISFDYRLAGPYPVESVEGAVQIKFRGNRAVYLKRLPDFGELAVSKFQTFVITPEEALRFAAEFVPGIMIRPVRDLHMAYLVRPSHNTTQPEWLVEPSWVVLAGDSRIYVPASRSLDRRVITVVR